MNSMTKFWPSLKFRILAIQLNYQPVTLKQKWYKHFIHTLQYLNQIPTKKYENYFYKWTSANQCLSRQACMYVYMYVFKDE